MDAQTGIFYYRQSTGELGDIDGTILAVGYSGHGSGVNNPAMQNVRDVGPIPLGDWHLDIIVDGDGNPIDYERKAKPVFRLTPSPFLDTFGRDGFLIHGDLIDGEVEAASKGCIIMPHVTRLAIAARVADGCHTLRVIE